MSSMQPCDEGVAATEWPAPGLAAQVVLSGRQYAAPELMLRLIP